MKVMMLKTPVTTKKLGCKRMIYYIYYGSLTRIGQIFCPFCVFTHGHVKRHQRHIVCLKGLTNTFISVSLQLRCTGFISPCLWGAIPAQNVHLAVERSIPATRRKYISFSPEWSVSPWHKGHRALQEANTLWRVMGYPSLSCDPQGKTMHFVV